MSGLACVVLAAGKGTRMCSGLPKVLHPLAGRPMVEHVLASARALAPVRTVLLIGPEMETAARGLEGAGEAFACVVQEKPLGTAHAVAAARRRCWRISTATCSCSMQTRRWSGARPWNGSSRRGAKATAWPPRSWVFGRRIQRSTAGSSWRRTGRSHASSSTPRPAKRSARSRLCNAGMMAIDGRRLFSLLDAIGNGNEGGEYYLTDLPAIVGTQGGVCAIAEAPAEEVMGINDRVQLAAAERVIQDRLRRAAMEGGATLVDPATVWLSLDTRLGSDVTIGPNVVIGPGVTLEDGAEIRPFSHLEGVRVGRGALIGPFARLRPGSEIGEEARVGNFVEVKNSTVERGAKINHLSYVGDAGVGAGANIGAGTITCNYDGYEKSRTEIGEGAFIGSNTALVAPVTVGPGAVVGAGSVITEDVEADAIAVARGEQRQREGAAARRRARRRPGPAED